MSNVLICVRRLERLKILRLIKELIDFLVKFSKFNFYRIVTRG